MGELVSQAGNFGSNNLVAYLESQGIVLSPVEPSRRLLTSLPEGYPMTEFFDSQQGARIIAAPAEGPDSATHDLLRERGLPVFEDLEGPPDVRLWWVPFGTRPLGSILHALQQNIEKYGLLIPELTSISARLYNEGLGSPTPANGRRVLDQFAFVQAPETEYGASLFLTPPYSINPAQTPDVFATTALEELTQTGLFDTEQLQRMQHLMAQGVAG